jgi:hypothetical protein
MEPVAGAGSTVADVEALLVELVAGIAPAPRTGPGRPPVLPAAVLWASLAIGVLRGAMSQSAIWRIVTAKDLWRGPRITVTDEAVFRRLATTDPSPLAELFAQFTALLLARRPLAAQQDLAPFATDVVVIDETTLDPVARSLPGLRAVPAGDDRLLPGKIAGIFDVRRHLWRELRVIATPHQNERVAAPDLVATLAPGTLILADLGYFGFEWFDELTDGHYWWVSRLRAKTSYEVVHVHHQDATSFDGLVWLGAYRADRAKHLVRLVRFHDGAHERSYVTNVVEPARLTPAELTALYARRWDIELAVKLVKRELGLHLLWSAKPAVIAHQIWAVLLIAQLLQALRGEVADRAGVDLFEVSMTLLIRYLPVYAARSDDPIGAFVADGRWLGFIRPARRVATRAPAIPVAALTLPPPDLPRTRTPRYARRNSGPNGRK